MHVDISRASISKLEPLLYEIAEINSHLEEESEDKLKAVDMAYKALNRLMSPAASPMLAGLAGNGNSSSLPGPFRLGGDTHMTTCIHVDQLNKAEPLHQTGIKLSWSPGHTKHFQTRKAFTCMWTDFVSQFTAHLELVPGCGTVLGPCVHDLAAMLSYEFISSNNGTDGLLALVALSLTMLGTAYIE